MWEDSLKAPTKRQRTTWEKKLANEIGYYDFIQFFFAVGIHQATVNICLELRSCSCFHSISHTLVSLSLGWVYIRCCLGFGLLNAEYSGIIFKPFRYRLFSWVYILWDK